MGYFVYILRSLVDDGYYTGFTHDLERRLQEHNNGHSLYTSKHIPWELVYSEEVLTLAEARKREKYFKSAAGRKYRNKLLKSRGDNL